MMGSKGERINDKGKKEKEFSFRYISKYAILRNCRMNAGRGEDYATINKKKTVQVERKDSKVKSKKERGK